MVRFKVGDTVRPNQIYYDKGDEVRDDVKRIVTNGNKNGYVEVRYDNKGGNGLFLPEELDLVHRNGEEAEPVTAGTLIAALVSVFPDPTLYQGVRLNKAQVTALNGIISNAKNIV